MVIRLTTGAHIGGALRYNEQKVVQQQAYVLGATGFANDELAAKNRQYTTSVLECQSRKNLNVRKPTLHYSLSLHPSEQVSDEKFKTIAHRFMQEMGYTNQPYIVYRHHDTAHPHVHIVTTCVDEAGTKLNDSFIKRRTNAVRQKLEVQFNLIKAQGRGKVVATVQQIDPIQVPNPGELQKKEQLETILRQTFDRGNFTSIDEFTSLLKKQQVRAILHQSNVAGKAMRGISYQLTDAVGKPVTPRIKASEIGGWVTWNSVEKQAERVSAKEVPAEKRETSQGYQLPFEQYKALAALLSEQLRDYKQKQGIYYDSELTENFPTAIMQTWLGKFVGEKLTEFEVQEIVRRFEEYKRSQLPEITRKEQVAFKRTMETYSQIAAEIKGSVQSKLQFFSALSVNIDAVGMIRNATNRHLIYQAEPGHWALVQQDTGPDLPIPKTYSRGERTTMLLSASDKPFRESYYDVRSEHLTRVLTPDRMGTVHRQLNENYVARLMDEAPVIGMDQVRHYYHRGIVIDAYEQTGENKVNYKIRYKDTPAQEATEPGQLFSNQIPLLNLEKWQEGLSTEAGRYMVALAQCIDREKDRAAKVGAGPTATDERVKKSGELTFLRDRIHQRDPTLTFLSDQDLLNVLETRSQQGAGWIQQREQDKNLQPDLFANERSIQGALTEIRAADVLGHEQTGKYKHAGKGIKKRGEGREL